MSHCSYLSNVFSPIKFNETINSIVEIIEKEFPDVDYIAGSGISGALVLGAISNMTGKRIFFVRKENDDSHSYKTSNDVEEKESFCEFEEIENKWATAIFIDDLISSGNTIMRVIDKLHKNDIFPAGIILYDETGKDWNYKDWKHNIMIPVFSVDKSED